MAHEGDGTRTAKISPEFDARLRELEPHQMVRVILLLDDPGTLGGASAQPRSRADRRATIEALHQAVAPALSAIDRILERTAGKRLAPDVNALGAVPVETTAAGAQELAALGQVKAILEDQPISSLPALPW